MSLVEIPTYVQEKINTVTIITLTEVSNNPYDGNKMTYKKYKTDEDLKTAVYKIALVFTKQIKRDFTITAKYIDVILKNVYKSKTPFEFREDILKPRRDNKYTLSKRTKHLSQCVLISAA